MEKRFVVPAVSFLSAILIWVVFFVLLLTDNSAPGRGPWREVAVCLVVGGMVIFSAVRCHQAGGPRAGSMARAVALLIMALLTFWKVGVVAACVLLVAAIIAGTRYFMGSGKSQVEVIQEELS